MALDEPRDNDYSQEINGFTFLVEKPLYEKGEPFEVDYTGMGFIIKSNLKFEPSAGCGSCKCGED